MIIQPPQTTPALGAPGEIRDAVQTTRLVLVWACVGFVAWRIVKGQNDRAAARRRAYNRARRAKK